MSELIPIARPKGRVRANVIFVHGLGGDAYQTWTGSDDQNNPDKPENPFWPIWLAKDIEGLSVWTASIESSATNWAGTSMPLPDLAKNLAYVIRNRDRTASDEGERLFDKPLIFVCHSLGGLLIKKILKTAKENQEHDADAQRLLDAVKGIVFIATPHTGSRQAILLRRLRWLTWPSGVALDLVDESLPLRELNKWYTNWDPGLKHAVFTESAPVVFSLIVRNTSADPGIKHVDAVPLRYNHIRIAKPASREDEVYSGTRILIEDVISAHSHDAATANGVDSPIIENRRTISLNENPLRFQKILRVLLLIAGICAFDAMVTQKFICIGENCRDIPFPIDPPPIAPPVEWKESGIVRITTGLEKNVSIFNKPDSNEANQVSVFGKGAMFPEAGDTDKIEEAIVNGKAWLRYLCDGTFCYFQKADVGIVK